jgi:hypothetical protein
MLSGMCHCGDVLLDVPGPPKTLVNCNCSICRRYGALWAFYPTTEVRISGHPGRTTGYVWGARSIETFRCTNCGCVTHWEPLTPEGGDKIGVNIRNLGTPACADLMAQRHGHTSIEYPASATTSRSRPTGFW